MRKIKQRECLKKWHRVREGIQQLGGRGERKVFSFIREFEEVGSRAQLGRDVFQTRE